MLTNGNTTTEGRSGSDGASGELAASVVQDAPPSCRTVVFRLEPKCSRHWARLRWRYGARRSGHILVSLDPADQHVCYHDGDADRDNHRSKIEPRGPRESSLRHLPKRRRKPMLGAESGQCNDCSDSHPGCEILGDGDPDLADEASQGRCASCHGNGSVQPCRPRSSSGLLPSKGVCSFRFLRGRGHLPEYPKG